MEKCQKVLKDINKIYSELMSTLYWGKEVKRKKKRKKIGTVISNYEINKRVEIKSMPMSRKNN